MWTQAAPTTDPYNDGAAGVANFALCAQGHELGCDSFFVFMLSCGEVESNMVNFSPFALRFTKFRQEKQSKIKSRAGKIIKKIQLGT
jgi:hypothetical protein